MIILWYKSIRCSAHALLKYLILGVCMSIVLLAICFMGLKLCLPLSDSIGALNDLTENLRSRTVTVEPWLSYDECKQLLSDIVDVVKLDYALQYEDCMKLSYKSHTKDAHLSCFNRLLLEDEFLYLVSKDPSTLTPVDRRVNAQRLLDLFFKIFTATPKSSPLYYDFTSCINTLYFDQFKKE